MIRLSFIAGTLIALFFGFGSDLSFATERKAIDNISAKYVIQMGAYRDQKSAAHIIRNVRSVGVELYWARKDNSLYILQSQNFTSRDKADALAANLVAGKLIKSYFITTTPAKTISRISADEGTPESHPTTVVQPQKKDISKGSPLFTLFETEPDKLEEAALAVLEANPADSAALKAIAWHQFRRGHYEDAYNYFAELNRLEPELTDHVTGMIYALSGMDKIEEVMELSPTVSSFFYSTIGELPK